MKKKTGFTLIELMIVVAIIAIIAAIAIPNLLRARMTSNETSAIGNCRTINGAETSYHAVNNQYTDLAGLGVAAPPFLDGDWTITKSGYNFSSTTDGNTYTVNADPAILPGNAGATGERQFYTDVSGVVTFLVGGQAGPGDTPISQ